MYSHECLVMDASVSAKATENAELDEGRADWGVWVVCGVPAPIVRDGSRGCLVRAGARLWHSRSLEVRISEA